MAQDEPPREPTPVERDRRRMQVDGLVFGARMKERRRTLGWSVHDLHAVTGVASSTISDLERGRTPSPAPWVTHALAVAMGCPSAGDLLSWMAARERGEAYEPEAGRGAPFGPARLPGAGRSDDVRLDLLVEQLLRGVARALGPTAVAVTVALGEEPEAVAPLGAQPGLPGGPGYPSGGPLIVLAVGNFFGGVPVGAATAPTGDPAPSGGAEGGGEVPEQ